MTTAAHTPTPWSLHSWPVNRQMERCLRGGERPIATMQRASYAEADAAFIITAVNHHDALIAVCRDLLAWGDGGRSPVKPLPAILATMRSLLQSATGAPEDAT